MGGERGVGIQPSGSTHHRSGGRGCRKGLNTLPLLIVRPQAFNEVSNKEEVRGINKSDFIELSSDILGVGDLLVPIPLQLPVTHLQLRHRGDHSSPKGKGSESPSVYKGGSREMGHFWKRKQGPLSQGGPQQRAEGEEPGAKREAGSEGGASRERWREESRRPQGPASPPLSLHPLLQPPGMSRCCP